MLQSTISALFLLFGTQTFRRSAYQAFVWLLYTSVGLAFPVGAGLLVVWASREASIELGAITDGGQFYVFTAVMLTETVYLITKPTNFRIPLSEWYGLVAVTGLIASSVLFAITLFASSGGDVDVIGLRWPGIGLAAGALAITFLVVLRDALRQNVDVQEFAEQDENQLRRDFRRQRP